VTSPALQKFGRALRRQAVLGKPRQRLWGSGRRPEKHLVPSARGLPARRPQRAAAIVPDGTSTARISAGCRDRKRYQQSHDRGSGVRGGAPG
jgi:hypothetical protein